MSQAQAQAQAASMGGGFGGGSLSQSQAQAQAQSASKRHTPCMQLCTNQLAAAAHAMSTAPSVHLSNLHFSAGQGRIVSSLPGCAMPQQHFATVLLQAASWLCTCQRWPADQPGNMYPVFYFPSAAAI